MRLVVGLGNPGDKYKNTRHNVGFQVVEQLAAQAGEDFTACKWKASMCKVSLAGHAVLLVKPETFMNLSGEAVAPIATYYKIAVEDIIVVHDDLDLDCGRVKLGIKRGAGGHNGIKSLIQHLGGNDFARVRIGIGRPTGAMPVERYVLAPVGNDEHDQVTAAIDMATEAVRLIIDKGLAAATQLIHSKKS